MSTTYRYRTRGLKPTDGYSSFGGVIFPSVTPYTHQRTEDIQGARNQSFSSTLVEAHGGRWNGYAPDFWFRETIMNNYYSFVNGDLHANIDHEHPQRPSLTALATQLVAETNPSRPVVDLPVFIAELKDIPEMLYLKGKDWIRKAASANLSYQFGWKPLIGDLSKLMLFTDFFSAREREVRALAQSGLRRKRQLWADRYEADTYSFPNFFVHDVMYYDIKWRQYSRAWGYVEWVPTSFAPQTDDAIRSAARRAALGLTVDFSTAWELIPWSWLVDWCTNAGDYLMASRNIVGAEPRNILIMQNTIRSTIAYPTSHPRYFQPREANLWRTEFKGRWPATVGFDAGFPFLSARKLSILGSIGVLADRRRR